MIADAEPCQDWSTEQAKKHFYEIRSLLGNFLLRTTSGAIQHKISTLSDPIPKLPDISSSSYLPDDALHQYNRHVLATLQNLGSNVRSSLDGLKVAEALDQIMLCLKEVRIYHQTFGSFS